MTTINIEERVAKAASLFKQGYNCAQAVVMAYADLYHMDETLASHVSASFGGGIGRMRETCGAACGMFILAGLAVEGTYPDAELKKRNYEVVQHLAQAFRQENGSLLCRELLGLAKKQPDGTVPEVKIVAAPEPRTAEYYKKRPCVMMVETAARIFGEYINNRESAI